MKNKIITEILKYPFTHFETKLYFKKLATSVSATVSQNDDTTLQKMKKKKWHRAKKKKKRKEKKRKENEKQRKRMKKMITWQSVNYIKKTHT